ncbi:MAG: nucleotidyl transferase AbiEii/AbiGii toxin family protein [Anaerolineales bacterium]|nr:nucleotidyl transferase AbiEii/AbiGii toxin family protein [Anaerolineales bacterium]
MVRLRKLVAFDRLLARLLYAESEAWVLKGGLAIQLRLGEHARTTKDIDITWRQSASGLHQLLVTAASMDVDDWFRFVVEQPGTRQEALPGGGSRLFVHALLDSRPFESFHMDIGVGDPVLEPVQFLAMPALLDFADISPSVVPCYPITQQLAEKVHAYTRPHITGIGSRGKDLVDILLLAGLQPLQGSALRLALQATFEACDTHPLPATLPEPPDSWAQPLRRMADETGLAWREIREAATAARQFLNPVLQRQHAGTWNPVTWTWES